MKEYEIVVGLEVHAELSTNTKIYCGCKNAFGAPVNTNVCPICLGMPGTLPTLNREVVRSAARMGLATHCRINRVTKQDRKNYFYPDLPKDYQISQFDLPLCEHGYVDVLPEGGGETFRVGVTRIHIEEDAGKLIHDDASALGSLVDFNRCGVPLIEIVSEPDLRSAADARAYLETIKGILQYLDISDCKMQEGSIRCDVNVSVRERGCERFGTRCEMKNVNSFSGVYRAIEYEAARQIAILNAGGEVVQETRRWDDAAGKSVLLRSKEDAHDYRYFPEPDLGPIVIPEEELAELADSIPELPTARLLRLMADYALPLADAALLVDNPDKAAFFEATAALGVLPKPVCNWLLGDVTRILTERRLSLAETSLSPQRLAAMLRLIEVGTISNTAAKQVVEDLMLTDADAEAIVKARGLAQLSDSDALRAAAAEVLSKNEKVVADYLGGKTNALGFLVGQCMRATKGKGNPELLRALLLELIDQP